MNKIAERVIGILLFIGGYILAGVVGWSTVLVPLFCISFVYWALGKTAKGSQTPMMPALSLIGGQLLWAIIGVLIMLAMPQVFGEMGQPFTMTETAIGIVVTMLFFLWLFLRPGLISGLANLIYVLISMWTTFGTYTMLEGHPLQGGLVVHQIIYVLTIVALIYGFIGNRKSEWHSRITG